jgi:V/A-type H+-transporting ATPase subunit K
MLYVLPLLVIAALCIPLFIAYRQKVTGRKIGSTKRAIITNLCIFAAVCLTGIIVPLGGFASAASAGTTVSVGAGLAYIGAALATGISGIGGGIAVGQGSAAAIGAITEEPKVFGRALLFVGLGESVALYGFVIAIMIVTKL